MLTMDSAVSLIGYALIYWSKNVVLPNTFLWFSLISFQILQTTVFLLISFLLLHGHSSQQFFWSWISLNDVFKISSKPFFASVFFSYASIGSPSGIFQFIFGFLVWSAKLLPFPLCKAEMFFLLMQNVSKDAMYLKFMIWAISLTSWAKNVNLSMLTIVQTVT